MKHKIYCLIFLITLFATSQAQYWQQAVSYTMDIDFDVENHRFEGTQ